MSVVCATGFPWEGMFAAIGVVIGVVVQGMMSSIGSRADRRRDRYGEALASLVELCSLPYSIRRRTSDSAEELSRLVSEASRLQTRLRSAAAWLATDSAWVSEVYRGIWEAVREEVGPLSVEAWRLAPAGRGEAMTVGDWGPREFLDEFEYLERVFRCRFGWRRLAAAVGMRPEGPGPEPELRGDAESV